jgi:uncharacterized protein (DUF433 family)
MYTPFKQVFFWSKQMGMTKELLTQRISIDPNVCFGKPCIKGRRLWVSLILDMLVDGMTYDEIMKEYDISIEDIRACIAYGSEMSRDRFIPVTHES